MTGHSRVESMPFVSVIVPIYNAEAELPGLIESLAAQTYPVESHEILLVDNGSRDQSRAMMERLTRPYDERFRLLDESATRGSYAARNHGLSQAQGELIAFTDADCRPVETWIEAGVSCLQEQSADLAGGQVLFTYKNRQPSAAEWVDARTNMQMEQDITNRGVTKTANLFVWRKLFDAIGPFRSDLQSGGDVEWTGRATQNDYQLVFAEKAVLYHPARSWAELFKKQVRVGRGQMEQRGSKTLTTGIGLKKTGRSVRSLLEQGAEAPFWRGWIVMALVWARVGTLLGRLLWKLRTKRR